MSVALQARREEGRRVLPASPTYRARGLLVRRGAVGRGRVAVSSGSDEAVAAQELRDARAGALDRLAGIADTLAEELAVFALRLDDVLEPLARKSDRALL